jgi:hypothetical protein
MAITKEEWNLEGQPISLSSPTFQSGKEEERK